MKHFARSFLKNYFDILQKSKNNCKLLEKCLRNQDILGSGILQGLMKIVSFTQTSFFINVKYPKSEDLTFNFLNLQTPTRGLHHFRLVLQYHLARSAFIFTKEIWR